MQALANRCKNLQEFEKEQKMPLDRRVTFTTTLKKNNLLPIPKLVRWQYKLEPSQVLKVTVSVLGAMSVRETYLAKMYKEGRILVPQLTLALLKQNVNNLESHALEGTLEPT